jgi:hypothetical protein
VKYAPLAYNRPEVDQRVAIRPEIAEAHERLNVKSWVRLQPAEEGS